MKVNGKDDISYMKWKIKLMFETMINDGEYLLVGGFNDLEQYESQREG